MYLQITYITVFVQLMCTYVSLGLISNFPYLHDPIECKTQTCLTNCCCRLYYVYLNICRLFKVWFTLMGLKWKIISVMIDIVVKYTWPNILHVQKINISIIYRCLCWQNCNVHEVSQTSVGKCIFLSCVARLATSLKTCASIHTFSDVSCGANVSGVN